MRDLICLEQGRATHLFHPYRPLYRHLDRPYKLVFTPPTLLSASCTLTRTARLSLQGRTGAHPNLSRCKLIDDIQTVPQPIPCSPAYFASVLLPMYYAPVPHHAIFRRQTSQSLLPTILCAQYCITVMKPSNFLLPHPPRASSSARTHTYPPINPALMVWTCLGLPVPC